MDWMKDRQLRSRQSLKMKTVDKNKLSNLKQRLRKFDKENSMRLN